MRKLVLLGVAAAVACAIAGVLIVKHRAGLNASTTPLQATRPAAPAPAAVPEVEPAPESSALPMVVADRTPGESTPPVAGQPQAKPDAKAAPPKAGGPAKEPLKDPEARDALAFVGADWEAEVYWCGAINNPDLPAHERQDLIEDLNEEGFADPKHPTPEDLPLILNRILLIEDLGPYAMDQVNADAFAEAYKDLLNLADLAMGDGISVK
jgi:hypothetical protein